MGFDKKKTFVFYRILLLNTLALNPQEGWIVVGRGVYNETPESDLDLKKNLYLHLVDFIRFV